MDEALKILQQNSDVLPSTLKEYITRSDWDQKTSKIASEEGLSDEQTWDLLMEVAMVLYGTTHIGDFIDNIEESLGLRPEKAESIAYSINNKIFRPIMDSLGDMYEAMLIEEGEVPQEEKESGTKTPSTDGSKRSPKELINSSRSIGSTQKTQTAEERMRNILSSTDE